MKAVRARHRLSTATFAAAELVYFSSSLVLRDASYLSSFTPDQQNTIALLAVKTFNLGAGVFMVFYGIATLIRGALIFRSGYLPRALGALLAMAGLGFITRAFLVVLAPRFASPLFLAPMFLAFVATAVWFAVRGIDAMKWEERVSAARP